MIFYTLVIIILKFLYQLPLFCGSPSFSLFLYSTSHECSTSYISPKVLASRIDFIIGIRKFSGI